MSTTKDNGGNLFIQGRIVWSMGSNLFEGKAKTDYNTNQGVFGEDGLPVKEYGFGLAIPKVDARTGQPTADFTKIWNTLHQEAFTLYPSGQLPPDFAMKYKDGDGIDHNGRPFSEREGYKGHIVLSCTTQIPIKYFRFEGGNNILVNDGIKCGDYVNVQLNIKAHPAKGRGKPGLYLNPSAVQLIQPGKEIINSPSGDQLFGTTPPVYSGEVVAPQQAPMPGMGQAAFPSSPMMPAQPNFNPPMQQPQYPAAAPLPAANPHYGVLPQTHQPATPVQQPQYPAAAPQMPGMPMMPGMPR